MGKGAVGYVGSEIKYAPYVIGKGTQAKVHRGRWYTLEGVVNNLRSGIVNVYRRAIRSFIK